MLQLSFSGWLGHVMHLQCVAMIVHSTLVFIFLFGGFLQVAVTQNEFGVKLTTEKQKVKNSTQYLFQYYVKDDATGDYKTQEETRNGDSVWGTYSLTDPNGDLRKVTYEAGPDKGFEAKVDIVSKSPINSTTESISTSNAAKWNRQSEQDVTDSKVNHFPGGFMMNILKKPHLINKKSEMGMKFSMKLDNATEPFVEAVANSSTTTFRPKSNYAVSSSENINPTVLKDIFNSRVVETEKSTTPALEKETTDDPVEKQIDEIINSIPKLPELVFSDNKTHFKFYKDPEEAAIDERISQIARQLAETSMRREYEEQKLGHFIPISLKPIESSPATDFSKSLKFTNAKLPYFRPTHFPNTFPVQVPLQITAVKIIPEYVYRETFVPNVPLAPKRLSLEPSTTSEPKKLTEQLSDKNNQTSETLKITDANKSDEKETNNISDKNKSELTKISPPYALVPLQVPTFLRVFTPIDRYLFPIQNKQEPQLLISHFFKDTTTGPLPPNDDFLYSHISTVDSINTNK